jgi:hypothetical protein
MEYAVGRCAAANAAGPVGRGGGGALVCESAAGRADEEAAQLAQLVQAATYAAMTYEADEAAKILAQAPAEAPERAHQGQDGAS